MGARWGSTLWKCLDYIAGLSLPLPILPLPGIGVPFLQAWAPEEAGLLSRTIQYGSPTSSLESLLEMQNIHHVPHLLNQNQYFNKIPQVIPLWLEFERPCLEDQSCFSSQRRVPGFRGLPDKLTDGEKYKGPKKSTTTSHTTWPAFSKGK